jgi:hypothetical protein
MLAAANTSSNCCPFSMDGFILESQQKVTGVEFITPMGHHRLDKNVAN